MLAWPALAVGTDYVTLWLAMHAVHSQWAWRRDVAVCKCASLSCCERQMRKNYSFVLFKYNFLIGREDAVDTSTEADAHFGSSQAFSAVSNWSCRLSELLYLRHST